MKNNNFVTGVLDKLLLIVWWGMLFITIAVSIDKITGSEVKGNLFYGLFVKILVVAIYLYAIAKLRGILNTVLNKEPFTEQNIKRFKNIGYAVFAAGVINAIVNFPEAMEGSLLVGTPYGGIRTDILIYIIFGCLALILAEVFKQALIIKEENDLTI